MNIDYLRGRVERYVARCPMSGCWLWTGCVTTDGYGRLFMNGKATTAHRVAWNAYRGEIPAGMHVLHRCDVPSCVKPSHLFLGTHADNMMDRNNKGRSARFIGEDHPRAKLTAADVARIRDDHRVYREIAAEVGVTPNMISRIKTGKAWTHI